jgi:hypothetical protein
VFAEMQQRKALAEELPLRAVLRDHRGAIILSMLLTWLLSAGIVVVILMTPACCRASTTSARPTRSRPTAWPSCCSAWLHRRRQPGRPLWRGRVFVIGSLLLLASSWTFYHSLPTRPTCCSRCTP